MKRKTIQVPVSLHATIIAGAKKHKLTIPGYLAKCCTPETPAFDLAEMPDETRSLIAAAAEALGTPVHTFIATAAKEAAVNVQRTQERAARGDTNVKGTSDQRIIEAAEACLKAGMRVTCNYIRTATGCNRLAVRRVLADRGYIKPEDSKE